MAWFERPNIWDVAGGIALSLAAGQRVLEHENGRWNDFTLFSREDREPGAWSAPIALGQPQAIEDFRLAEA